MDPRRPGTPHPLGLAFRRFGLPAFVALGLAVGLYYLALLVAPLHPHSGQTFFGFETLGLEDLMRAWRSRVLSLRATGVLADLNPWLPELPTRLSVGWQEVAIAQWAALWSLGISAIQIASRRERALFPMLGTFACVAFGYVVGEDLRIYPWDLPALAVFTAVVALVEHESRPLWIVLVIWLGMAFKETAAVLFVFPLALAMSRRERTLWAALTLGGCVAIKLGLDHATGNSAVGLTMATASFYDEGPLWWWNLRQLETGIPLLANAGTLLAFLLLPNASRRIVAFKLVALLFVAGNLLFGAITEYRIWFEMVPLALWALEDGLRRPETRPA